MPAGPDRSFRQWAIRSLPRQFGLRSLLILTAIAAFLLWQWTKSQSGVCNDWNAARIKVGMTRDEVIAKIGHPFMKTLDQPSSTWTYRVDRLFLTDGSLTIWFSPRTGRVGSVHRGEFPTQP